VECRYRRKSIELILRIPDQDPWLRLKVRGADLKSTLEPRYAPYARQCRFIVSRTIRGESIVIDSMIVNGVPRIGTAHIP
jgi:hypothetical protein